MVSRRVASDLAPRKVTKCNRLLTQPVAQPERRLTRVIDPKSVGRQASLSVRQHCVGHIDRSGPTPYRQFGMVSLEPLEPQGGDALLKK